MKIYMYIVKKDTIFQKFEEYSKLANQIFDCDENEFESMIEKTYSIKNEIENELGKIAPMSVFDEDFYDEQIDDEKTKMLLSNGLYSEERIIGLLEKCSQGIRAEIEDSIKTLSKDDLILFWNC